MRLGRERPRKRVSRAIVRWAHGFNEAGARTPQKARDAVEDDEYGTYMLQ